MTLQERQRVVDVLRNNVRHDYGEARPDRCCLPQLAVSNATGRSLQAFVEIHEELVSLVRPDHCRTRYIGLGTSTGGYGFSYYMRPVINKAANRTNREIQAVCLPTKSRWQGFLEVYFSGHDEVPMEVEPGKVQDVGRRAGRPIFHVRDVPTAQFVTQTIAAFRRSALWS